MVLLIRLNVKDGLQKNKKGHHTHFEKVPAGIFPDSCPVFEKISFGNYGTVIEWLTNTFTLTNNQDLKCLLTVR